LDALTVCRYSSARDITKTLLHLIPRRVTNVARLDTATVPDQRRPGYFSGHLVFSTEHPVEFLRA